MTASAARRVWSAVTGRTAREAVAHTASVRHAAEACAAASGREVQR